MAAETDSEHAMTGVVDYCAMVGCWKAFEQTEGRGRRRLYCSDDCRRDADKLRDRTRARIEHLRSLIARSEHLLAALSGCEEDRQPRTLSSGRRW